MKNLLVEVRDEAALEVLQALEKTKLIKLNRKKNRTGTKTFRAVKLDTRGFKFNRDEANER